MVYFSLWVSLSLNGRQEFKQGLKTETRGEDCSQARTYPVFLCSPEVSAPRTALSTVIYLGSPTPTVKTILHKDTQLI